MPEEVPPEIGPKVLLGLFSEVVQPKKVRGRLPPQLDRMSSIEAFNAWFVRSRESHACMWTPDLVCQLFSTGALLLAAALPQHPAEPPEEAMKS